MCKYRKLLGWVGILIIVLGLLQSCGTRKVGVDINKQSEKVDERSKEKGSEESKSEAKSQSKEETKADKTEDIVTTTTVDELNDKGEVIKRTQTTKTENRKDNSTSNKSASEESKTFSYKTWIKTYWKVVTIKVFSKQKTSETSNIAFYVVMGVLGAIALLFGYLYIKVRKKLTDQLKKPLEEVGQVLF